MNKLLSFFFMLGCSFFVHGQQTNQGFKVQKDNLQISVDCLGDAIIHVRVVPEERSMNKSLVVPENFSLKTSFNITNTKERVRLQTPLLAVTYYHEEDIIEFVYNKTGETVLKEKFRELTPANMAGENVLQVRQTFQLKDTDAIYGLGQYQDGYMNYRGKSVKLLQANMEIANPVLLSSGKYGILWDNYSKTLFDDNESGASFWSEVADGIDYYFFYGETMDDLIASYHQLTGAVPMFKKTVFGFWQSKERYKSFDELTDVVAEYRRRQVPIDNIVQDWEYWGEQSRWNSMRFDEANFSQPEKRIAELHDKYKVEYMISVWPGVGRRTEIYKDMESISALFDEPTWANYKVIDIYNPEARKVFWKHLHDGLYSKGVDGWWLDATEPSFREGFSQDRQEEITKSAGQTYIGSFHRYLNVYSLFLTQMVYENLRKEKNERVSILTRSAFAGQQKYATAVWSGDVSATWDVFKKQIPAGLNLCMTGIPYWTSDIGAFFVTTRGGDYPKGLADPAYKELYIRWFQYGAFSPLFRAHGSNVPREIWQFGDEGDIFYDAQVEMINTRYRLLSYIYSSAWQVTSNSKLMMRGLPMDFSSDRNILDNGESYMFGNSLLVHPVTKPMYYDKEGAIQNPQIDISIYLPEHKGDGWYDFYTNEPYQGGKSIDYNAPMNKIPVFVKAGSIIPYNQVVQYVDEKKNDIIDICVYTGADAVFELYEDDNVSYDYEKGNYSLIRFNWNDGKQALEISDKEGLYTYLDQREFRIKIISPEKTLEKQVVYDNTSIKLNFPNL